MIASNTIPMDVKTNITLSPRSTTVLITQDASVNLNFYYGTTLITSLELSEKDALILADEIKNFLKPSQPA